MIDPGNPDFSNTPVSAQRPRFDYAPADPLAAPAVSIVTPFYNTGAIFHETARSILQQSFQQWEWLIVNDGSTDPGALAVLAEYRERDPRIRVIDHAENRGLSAARNTGYAAARCEYVVQIDSDDLLEPTAIEKWFWFLLTHEQYAFTKGMSVVFGAKEFLKQGSFAGGSAFLETNQINYTAMVRRSVQQAVGGYDEAMRDGMEDWEFWLHCAHAGYWGASLPEYLDWRRRRPDPTDRWLNLSDSRRTQAVIAMFHQRYGRLWKKDGFPQIAPRPHAAYAAVPEDLPCANSLAKQRPRLLLLTRCLPMGGGSVDNLNLARLMAERGWDVTIVATDREDNSWLPRFAAHTPDIFLLPDIVRLVDYPRFLRYLISSRRVDIVLSTSSEAGYLLLPYLRAHFPSLPIVDYCHIENEARNNGGFPRLSLIYSSVLDLTGVTSEHLRQWMIERGGDGGKIVTSYVHVDSQDWQPDTACRTRLRQEMGLADDLPVIVFAGRLVPQKQPRVLGMTALRLKQQGARCVLLVAGEGQDLPWLRRFVAQHHLESHVRLLGPMPQQRVQELLPACDIMFLPSHNEGISGAMREAMSCGLAIVGAAVGGQSELATPDCAVLIQHKDEEADTQEYTRVLAALLRDPERYRAMGKAARRRIVERFSLQQSPGGLVATVDEGLRRGAAVRPPLPLGVAQASATLAVEYLRLIRQAGAAPATAAVQQRAARRVPKVLRRLTGWAINPPATVAPVVNGAKRLLPVSLKVYIKKRIWLPR